MSTLHESSVVSAMWGYAWGKMCKALCERLKGKKGTIQVHFPFSLHPRVTDWVWWVQSCNEDFRRSWKNIDFFFQSSYSPSLTCRDARVQLQSSPKLQLGDTQHFLQGNTHRFGITSLLVEYGHYMIRQEVWPNTFVHIVHFIFIR